MPVHIGEVETEVARPHTSIYFGVDLGMGTILFDSQNALASR